MNKISREKTYIPHNGQIAFHHACDTVARFVAMIVGIRGGKCLYYGQEVLMADGNKKKAIEINVGDKVLGYNPETGESVPCNVVDTSLSIKDTAEYTMSDKSSVICSKDHAFPCWNAKRKKFEEKPIEYISQRNDNYLYLLGSESIKFESRQELAIDPYILGVILGDCNISQNGVTIMNPDKEVVECFSSVNGTETVKRKAKDTYGIVSRQRDEHGYSYNPLVTYLRNMGLMGKTSHNKFIPKECLCSTERDRREILAGLIDTDGHVDERGHIEYSTVSKQLAEDVLFLLRSLGVRATIRTRTLDTNFKKGCISHRIHFKTSLPLRVERKLGRIKQRVKQCSHRVYIDKSIDMGENLCVDISIDHPTHLFLLDNMIATHNTYGGARQANKEAWNCKTPGVYGIIAPTYKMLKRTTWREYKMAARPWILHENKSDFIITLRNGREVMGFTAEDYDSIRNVTLSGFWVDEARECKDFAGLWDVLMGRVLSTGGKGFVTSSPNGFDALHDVFIENAKKDYLYMTYATYMNRYIPKGAIDELAEKYDEKFMRQEIMGEFVVFDGQVYYTFNRNKNAGDIAFKKAQYDPSKPINLCCDFNVDPMAWEICQTGIGDHGLKEVYWIDEIYIKNSNTIECCEEFRERYPNHMSGVHLYGDATGNNRSANSNRSNWAIIKNEMQRYQPVYHVPLANPAERDRVNATNGMICNSKGQVRTFINPKKCRHLMRDFEQVPYKKGTTKIDKTRNLELTHASDSAGYFYNKEFSVIDTKLKGLGI